MFDHNVRKPYRIGIRELRELRHFQVAGGDLSQVKSLVERFFQRRMFQPGNLRLSESARMTLKREWKTPLKDKPEVLWKHLTV